MIRKHTTRILDAAESGALTWEAIAREFLAQTSEAACEDVADALLGVDDDDDDEVDEDGVPRGALLMTGNDAPEGWVEVQKDDDSERFEIDEQAALAVSTKAREIDGRWYVPTDRSER